MVDKVIIMKKKNQIGIYFLIVCCLLIPDKGSFAQVGGISGSKLCVPDAGAVQKGKFEFEPSLSVFRSSKEFDSEWNLKSLNGFNDASILQFRITLGVADGLEIGTSFSTTLEDIFIGSKAVLFSGAKSSMAILAGISLPADNKTPDDTLASDENKHSFSLGSTYSLVLSEVASLDLLFSYSVYSGHSQFNSALNYGASLGYKISDDLQAVMELNGYSTFKSSLYSVKLSVTPGITFRFSTNLLLVLGEQIDLLGKNDFSGTNVFCAFTMSF